MKMIILNILNHHLHPRCKLFLCYTVCFHPYLHCVLCALCVLSVPYCRSSVGSNPGQDKCSWARQPNLTAQNDESIAQQVFNWPLVTSAQFHSCLSRKNCFTISALQKRAENHWCESRKPVTCYFGWQFVLVSIVFMCCATFFVIYSSSFKWS